MAELQRAQAESGWFSGWFGGGGSQNQEQTEKLPSGIHIFIPLHFVCSKLQRVHMVYISQRRN